MDVENEEIYIEMEDIPASNEGELSKTFIYSFGNYNTGEDNNIKIVFTVLIHQMLFFYYENTYLCYPYLI